MSREDLEIGLQRTVKAPRELVWRAYTEADQLGEWWGPDGFTITTHSIDVRVGGVWKFTVHESGRADRGNKITYIELVEPERITYDHGDFESAHFRVSVTFAELAGSTEVTLRIILETQALYDDAVKSGAVEGGAQALARLSELLER